MKRFFSISISLVQSAILFPSHYGKEWPMHTGRIVFSQILDFLPRYEFNKCVQRYQGNYDPKILLLRSIPLYGLCPTHLQRKPSRYRNLPAGFTAKALSCRHPQQNRAQYFGRSQRKQRLAHLFRFCPSTHPTRPTILCPGGFWRYLETRRLRFRFHNHRPLSFAFPGLSSVGTRPPSKSIRSWICAAVFPVLSASPAAKSTTSVSWTN